MSYRHITEGGHDWYLRVDPRSKANGVWCEACKDFHPYGPPIDTSAVPADALAHWAARSGPVEEERTPG